MLLAQTDAAISVAPCLDFISAEGYSATMTVANPFCSVLSILLFSTLRFTLTLPLTFTLTQSDTQKNKMHIWGSPSRVIYLLVTYILNL